MKKSLVTALVLLPLFATLMGIHLVTPVTNRQTASVTNQESQIISRINGTNAYNFDIELEKIALSHHAFRSAGSPGATEAAQLIKNKLESFGLQVSMEPYEFTNWNLVNPPLLVIDDDGNAGTRNDQQIIKTFQSAHYSWPTSEGGVFKDLVILPLPEARDREDFGQRIYNATAWNAINTTEKILLIGGEVRWDMHLEQVFVNKLRLQTPAAIIFTWWYEWMSSAPLMFSSSGGLPASSRGTYFWDLEIPVGWINYQDGLWIRNREQTINVSASLTIPAVIETGPQYNVVGKLKGSTNPEKIIVISGHYDTVMTSGFCDNGAGTAGVIELAKVFTEAARDNIYQPDYTLLFIAFSGEELGLIGSINYVRQHITEMKNITAVINLDCIGTGTFEISETFPDDKGLDLDEIVLKAAQDLNIKVNFTEPGGSDEESFRNPAGASSWYDLFWGADAGISNASRVKASIMLDSCPLFYSDKWRNGTPGWIHTQYDNSTSTRTLDWVDPDKLELHIQVAALSIIRLQAFNYSSLSQIITITLATSILIATVVYFERSRVSLALKRTYNSVLYYIEMKELVLIIILAVLLLFTSFISHTRLGKIEVMVKNIPSSSYFAFYGYPFEMIGIEQSAQSTATEQSEWSSQLDWLQGYEIGTMILWDGLVLNVVVYFLLSFLLTYFVSRLKNMYTTRKIEKS